MAAELRCDVLPSHRLGRAARQKDRALFAARSETRFAVSDELKVVSPPDKVETEPPVTISCRAVLQAMARRVEWRAYRRASFCIIVGTVSVIISLSMASPLEPFNGRVRSKAWVALATTPVATGRRRFPQQWSRCRQRYLSCHHS